MQTQEVAIKPHLKITMKADNEVLEEVVVTGMQRMDKRLFTGAATKLSADNVKLDGIAEISRALEGRAAGVSVQNVSGTFGTAPKIRVRGATSIYGSSKPLWVVDGVTQFKEIQWLHRSKAVQHFLWGSSARISSTLYIMLLWSQSSGTANLRSFRLYQQYLLSWWPHILVV